MARTKGDISRCCCSSCCCSAITPANYPHLSAWMTNGVVNAVATFRPITPANECPYWQGSFIFPCSGNGQPVPFLADLRCNFPDLNQLGYTFTGSWLVSFTAGQNRTGTINSNASCAFAYDPGRGMKWGVEFSAITGPNVPNTATLLCSEHGTAPFTVRFYFP